jgi:hypothetical protein
MADSAYGLAGDPQPRAVVLFAISFSTRAASGILRRRRAICSANAGRQPFWPVEVYESSDVVHRDAIRVLAELAPIRQEPGDSTILIKARGGLVVPVRTTSTHVTGSVCFWR